jgi:hypothetical protein
MKSYEQEAEQDNFAPSLADLGFSSYDHYDDYLRFFT